MASTSGQGGALSSRNNYWNAKTWIYDVFLSFRGEDTRRNFTDHLYNALVDKRIRTFRDDENMERGKVIKQEIPKAIEESMISIVIFSKNFAFSRWCLEEVAKIIQCMKELGQTVLPVFYHVDPSDVRNQTGSFGEAFKEYDGSKEKMETVQRWRDALSEAGNLSGWDLQYGYEYESKRIKEITEVVLKRLNREHPNFYKANEESEMTNMYIRKKNSYVQKYSWSGNISIPEGQRDIRLNRTCVFESNKYSFTCDFQDIDGCKNQRLDLCVNIDASFTSCPEGYHGVDSKEKKRPFVNPLQLIKVSIGSPWSYLGHKKRMLKDKLFQQNGGLVLPRMLRVKLFQRNSGLVRPRMPKVKLFQGNSGFMLPPMPKVKLFPRKSGLVLPRMPKVKLFKLNSGLQLNKDIVFQLSSLSLKHFTANEVKKITNNYDEIIGEGGSAIVYKGVLKSNIEVAVKRLKNSRHLETFVNEAVVLHRMNHKNVVSLLGWCFDTEFPVLVYEYVSNGTLDQHILDESRCWRRLSWEIRLRIAVEIARVLSFLHYEASPPIIHRDVKPSNILLDQNYTAKLTDFGLAKLDNTRENSNLEHKTLEESNLFTTTVKGTIGYLDPEYFEGRVLSLKSDVYGFGVVLVQLLTARKAVDTQNPHQEKWLAPYFSSCLENNRLFEIVDSCLILDDKKSRIKEFADLAHRCLQDLGCNRPTMRKVAQELSMMLEEESSNMVPHSTANSISLSRAASFHSTEISSPTSPFGSFYPLKETSYDSSTFI